MKLTIYILVSMVLLPCLGANQQDFEENSGNSLISLRRNEIIEYKLHKQVLTFAKVASIAAILVAIGTIQPMIFLLPLAIVWIIITVLLVFLSFGKEYDRIPFVPEPVEYIVALAMSLFVPPLSAVAFLIEHPSIILIAFEGLFDIK